MGSGPLVPSLGATSGSVAAFRPGAASEREPTGLGVRVALSSIAGLTSPRVLARPFNFQCAPLDNMPREYAWQWDDYVTIDGKTHSNPTAINASTYSFSSLFVDTNYRFVLVKEFDILQMIRVLKQIGDTMRPFQLQFGQPQLWGEWDVVAAVTMRGLHVEERHPEIDARYFTVSFTSYQDAPAVRAIPVPAAMKSASVGSGSATSENLSRPGVMVMLNSAALPTSLDTMSKISKVYYRDPGLWPVIAKASGLVTLSANENLVETVGSLSPAARIIVPELKPALVRGAV